MSRLFTSTDGNSVVFECPGCRCGHQVIVRRVEGKPLWTWNGSLEQPTFSPSILLQHDGWEPPVTPANLEEWHRQPWEQTKVRKVCHSFVTEGRIQFLADCTHELVNQTVELSEVTA